MGDEQPKLDSVFLSINFPTSRDDGTMTGGRHNDWRNTTPCHGSELIVVGGLSNRT